MHYLPLIDDITQDIYLLWKCYSHLKAPCCYYVILNKLTGKL